MGSKREDGVHVRVHLSIVEFDLREGNSISTCFPASVRELDVRRAATPVMKRQRSKSDLMNEASLSFERRKSDGLERARSISFEMEERCAQDRPQLPSGKMTNMLEHSFNKRLPFLALPDRSDARDDGFTFFVLRQAPDLVVGVSCFRQKGDEESIRNKDQRALCVLVSDIPLFAFVKNVINERADDILWTKNEDERIAKMKDLHAKLIMTIPDEIPNLGFKSISGKTSLVRSLRWLGGAKPAIRLLRCVLFGNTGVIVSGPSSSVVCQILVALVSVIPFHGGLLGSRFGTGEFVSAFGREMIESSMAILPSRIRGHSMWKSKEFVSKMLFMPYSSLIDLDDLRLVYLPRTAAESEEAGLSGRCGFLIGAVNPMISAQAKNNLGDLIVELDDNVLSENWLKPDSQTPIDRSGSPVPDSFPNQAQSPSRNIGDSGSGASAESSAKKYNPFSKESLQQFQDFSSKAARMFKEKTDEMVNQFQRWNAVPVKTEALSHAGRLATSLGTKDRMHARKIDRVLFQKKKQTTYSIYAKRTRHDSSSRSDRQTMKSFAGFMNNLVQKVAEDLKLDQKHQKAEDTSSTETDEEENETSEKALEEELDQISEMSAFWTDEEKEIKIRHLMSIWMNSLFADVEEYLRKGNLQNLIHTHNRDFIIELTKRTELVRHQKIRSEVFRFPNGDEYRGEILNVTEGFVDLQKFSNHRKKRAPEIAYMRSGFGVYVSFDGFWTFEGFWLNDRCHGQGSISNSAGDYLFDGEFENGVRCGEGVCVVKGKGKFIGTWEHDRPKNGKFFDNDGNILDGDFDGSVIREGYWTTAGSGMEYEGKFNSKGQPHGTGTTKLAKNSNHSGEYENGKRHGNGTYSFREVEYSGQFENDLFSGAGVLKFPCRMDPGDPFVAYLKGTFINGTLDTSSECTIKDEDNDALVYQGSDVRNWPGFPSVPKFAIEEATLPSTPDMARNIAAIFACPLSPLSSKDGKIFEGPVPSQQDTDTEGEECDDDGNDEQLQGS